MRSERNNGVIKCFRLTLNLQDYNVKNLNWDQIDVFKAVSVTGCHTAKLINRVLSPLQVISPREREREGEMLSEYTIEFSL